MLLTAVDSTSGATHWLEENVAWAHWTTGIATGLLVVGVAFAWYALRDARQTRHAQLLADFSRRWDEEEIIQSDELGRLYGSEGLVLLSERLYGNTAPDFTQPETVSAADLAEWHENLSDWLQALKWPNLLETIGVLTHASSLPQRLVYRMSGGPIIDAWKHWEPTVRAHRLQKQDDNLLRYFQWLAVAMERQRYTDREADLLTEALKHKGPVGAAIWAASSLAPVAEKADSHGSWPEP